MDSAAKCRVFVFNKKTTYDLPCVQSVGPTIQTTSMERYLDPFHTIDHEREASHHVKPFPCDTLCFMSPSFLLSPSQSYLISLKCNISDI